MVEALAEKFKFLCVNKLSDEEKSQLEFDVDSMRFLSGYSEYLNVLESIIEKLGNDILKDLYRLSYHGDKSEVLIKINHAYGGGNAIKLLALLEGMDEKKEVDMEIANFFCNYDVLSYEQREKIKHEVLEHFNPEKENKV